MMASHHHHQQQEMNSNKMGEGGEVEEGGEEVGVSQRLRWVKFTRDYDVTVEMKELYWPAIYYESHKEATQYSDNPAFQEEVVSALLMNYESQEADDDDDDVDLGPVCRLLGFEGDAYYRVVVDEKNDVVLNFFRNVHTKFITKDRKDKAFDMNNEDDQELYECYRAAFVEATAILDRSKRQRRKRNRRMNANADANVTKKVQRREEEKKDDEDTNNNNDDGGGGNNDDNNGNDKPDTAAVTVTAPAAKVSFQIIAPPAGGAASAEAVLPASLPNNENTVAALNNMDQVQMQETAANKEMEVESSEEVVVPAVTETAGAPAAEQEQPVAVTATTNNRKAKNNKKGPPEPPMTPPFNSPEMQQMDPHEPFSQVWNEMRYVGWIGKTIDDGTKIYLKPGRSEHGGVEGTDYFTSREGLQAYVQSKVQHWQPPAWVVEPRAAAAAAAPQQQRQRAAGGAASARRALLSSSSTVVTTESSNANSPPQQDQPPPRRQQRRSRAAVVNYSESDQAAPLTAYKVQDKVWWKKKPVPTLSQITPILLKLGIRRNDDEEDEDCGCYVIPEAVGRSSYVEDPKFKDLPTLRRFLCTRGIPIVPREQLLDRKESDLLHQWVSFAYVDTKDLPKDLKKLSLPDSNKIHTLLHKFSFENVDATYYPPLVKRSNVAPPDRKEGVHFYRGLDKLRDYVRSTATFTWTEDLLDVPEDEELFDNLFKEHALLRLWAASSPSDLPTYETSLNEIDHMEKILPQARQNEFGSEANEENDEEEDTVMGTDADDDQEETSLEEEASAVDESSDDGSNEDGGEDSSSSAVESAEESSSSEAENSEQESGASEAESTPGKSASSESEEGGSPDSESSSFSQSPIGSDYSASDATPEPAAKPSNKRKVPNTSSSGGSKRSKKEELPWWQNSSPPSFTKMKPILKKLGIVQDKAGVFVLPGKGRDESLNNPDSLREHLCSFGIPKYHKKDPLKPEPLQGQEIELLRRWVSFANFPASGDDFPLAIEKALPAYQRHFARGSDTSIATCACSLGFQPNTEGLGGFFPPGIDNLSRDKAIRKRHVKADLAEVRAYVRTSKNLRVANHGGIPGDEVSFHDTDAKELALRLWAALDKGPLLFYNVEPGTFSPLTKTENSSRPVTSAKLSKKRRKNVGSCPAEPTLELPDWFKETSTNELWDTINKHKAEKAGRKRPKTPHMSVESLEVACALRVKIVETLRASTRTALPKAFGEIIKNILASCDISERELKAFLCGDQKHMVRAVRLKEVTPGLKAWLDEKEGRVSGQGAGDVIAVSPSSAKPNASKRTQKAQPPVEVADNARTSETVREKNKKGSMVMCVDEATIDASEKTREKPKRGSMVADVNEATTSASGKTRETSKRGSMVTDIDDLSQEMPSVSIVMKNSKHHDVGREATLMSSLNCEEGSEPTKDRNHVSDEKEMECATTANEKRETAIAGDGGSTTADINATKIVAETSVPSHIVDAVTGVFSTGKGDAKKLDNQDKNNHEADGTEKDKRGDSKGDSAAASSSTQHPTKAVGDSNPIVTPLDDVIATQPIIVPNEGSKVTANAPSEKALILPTPLETKHGAERKETPPGSSGDKTEKPFNGCASLGIKDAVQVAGDGKLEESSEIIPQEHDTNLLDTFHLDVPVAPSEGVNESSDSSNNKQGGMGAELGRGRPCFREGCLEQFDEGVNKLKPSDSWVHSTEASLSPPNSPAASTTSNGQGYQLTRLPSGDDDDEEDYQPDMNRGARRVTTDDHPSIPFMLTQPAASNTEDQSSWPPLTQPEY